MRRRRVCAWGWVRCCKCCVPFGEVRPRGCGATLGKAASMQKLQEEIRRKFKYASAHVPQVCSKPLGPEFTYLVHLLVATACVPTLLLSHCHLPGTWARWGGRSRATLWAGKPPRLSWLPTRPSALMTCWHRLLQTSRPVSPGQPHFIAHLRHAHREVACAGAY